MRESDWNKIMRNTDIASRAMRQAGIMNNPLINGSFIYSSSLKLLMKRMENITPGARLFRDHNKLLGPWGSDMISEFSRIQGLGRPVREMRGLFEPNLLKSLYSTSRIMSDEVSNFSAVAGSFKDRNSNFNIFRDPAVQSLSSLVRSLDNFSNVADIPEMAIVLKQLQNMELGDDSFEVVIGQIESEMTTQIETLPPGRISLDGMSSNTLAVVLFLLSFVITNYLNCNSTKDQREYFNEKFNESQEINMQLIMDFETDLQEQMENLKLESEEGVFYVVERTIHLRQKSTKKSKSLGILYPNQKVKLLQRRHKWIQIEYFNYQDSKIGIGWVCKKYLKMES